MNIEAKLIKIEQVQKGQGKNGEWQKQLLIFETAGMYPKNVAITLWGKLIDELASVIKVGQSYKSYIDVESRGYNGNWYTDVRAWKIEPLGAEAKPTNQPKATPPQADFGSNEKEDDLPF